MDPPFFWLVRTYTTYLHYVLTLRTYTTYIPFQSWVGVAAALDGGVLRSHVGRCAAALLRNLHPPQAGEHSFPSTHQRRVALSVVQVLITSHLRVESSTATY